MYDSPHSEENQNLYRAVTGVSFWSGDVNAIQANKPRHDAVYMESANARKTRWGFGRAVSRLKNENSGTGQETSVSHRRRMKVTRKPVIRIRTRRTMGSGSAGGDDTHNRKKVERNGMEACAGKRKEQQNYTQRRSQLSTFLGGSGKSTIAVPEGESNRVSQEH